MRIYDRKLLKLDAQMENGHLQLEPSGPLGKLAEPFLGTMNDFFKDERPITIGDDQIIFSTWIPPIPSPAFERLIDAHKASLVNRRVPDQLSIGVTMRCPNDCLHCGAAGIEADPELSLGEVNRVVDEALDMGAYLVSFDGGEPMLRRDLADMISHVDKTRAVATTFTSGFNLTQDRAQKLADAGLYAARISLDSPFEVDHDHFRQRDGAYRDAIRGIENAQKAGILVDMFVVVSPQNIDHLEDFYSLAADLGVDEISLYEIVAVGRWLDREDETLTESDVERLKHFQKQKNQREDGPRVTAFPYFMGPELFGCFAGRRWAHVTAAGDVLPCAYTPISFGNVRDVSLEDAWKRMGQVYRWSADSCRMRDPKFREEYVHPIPDDELPYHWRQ